MSAGLPSTGIGSALYFVLIIWMFVRHMGRATINTSNSSQWPYIGKTMAMMAAMVAVSIGESILIYGAFKLTASHMPAPADAANVPIVLIIAMPFIILFLLMGCLHVVRLAVGRVTADHARKVVEASGLWETKVDAPV